MPLLMIKKRGANKVTNWQINLARSYLIVIPANIFDWIDLIKNFILELFNYHLISTLKVKKK